MKKYVITSALLAIVAAGQAMAACLYTLDATNSQINSIGAQPFNIKVDQRVRSPIAASTGTLHYAVGSQAMIGNILSGSLQGDKTIPTTGIVAFEYRVPYFPSTKPVDNGANEQGGEIDSRISIMSYDAVDDAKLSAIFYVHSGKNGIASYPESARAGGTISSGGALTTVPTTPLSLPLSTNFRVGVYLNQDTKQLGLILNGINQGYVFNYDKALKNIGFLISSTRSHINATDPVVGAYAGGALITDAADISYSYPSGAKDICGNTI